MLDCWWKFYLLLWMKQLKAINPKFETKKRKIDANEPFAVVFKIATDPYVCRLCFTRAYSGTQGTYVMNTRSGSKERISKFIKCTLTSKIRQFFYDDKKFVGQGYQNR